VLVVLLGLVRDAGVLRVHVCLQYLRIFLALLFRGSLKIPFMMHRKPALAAVGLVLLTLIGISIAYLRSAKAPPLGEAPSIEYPSEKVSQSTIRQFLSGRFSLIEDVRNLPPPVLRGFTEAGGSRLVIANPADDFESTDVIYDSSRPRKRLIFAGVSDDRCFVHYEQGGIGHSYILHLFRVSSNSMRPVWKGYCPGRAANLEELRSWLAEARCLHP
jgi:hypothetical protein